MVQRRDSDRGQAHACEKSRPFCEAFAAWDTPCAAFLHHHKRKQPSSASIEKSASHCDLDAHSLAECETYESTEPHFALDLFAFDGIFNGQSKMTNTYHALMTCDFDCDTYEIYLLLGSVRSLWIWTSASESELFLFH